MAASARPAGTTEGAFEVFRRRRSADAGQEGPEDFDQELSGGEPEYGDPYDDEPAGEQFGEGEGFASAGSGPWDVREPFPDLPRVDLGSLRVPVGPGHEVQLVMAEQHGAWVTVRQGGSEMQVQAFAAARNSTLWDDVRAEIAAEVLGAGGRSEERPGPFGIELLAQVPAEPGQPASGLRLVRFVGVDGPRWFLRGLFTGPAAAGEERAGLLEEVFQDIVVIRGEHPVPPRDILELRLPPEARQAFEEQAAAAEQGGLRTDLNPFERGPEFTETR
jgi:Protein of unknown function (DUF3710)